VSRVSRDLLPSLPPLADGARVIVGYSGGLDSTVLLHRLAAAGTPGLVAVHVIHGLQAAADDWAVRCATACAALDVPLTVLRASIRPDDAAGPEAAARAARYALLRSAMTPGDLLVTAHHRDDQVETVLLRLIRGTGVHGLAAMRPLSVFPPGQLWRPLLDQPRSALAAYALTHGLHGLEDPHNADPRYTRSWLRQSVLPGLRERQPQLDAALARTARLADEAAGLLDELARADQALAAQGAALSIAALAALSPPRRHNLVRHWLAGQGFRAPFAEMLDRLDRELIAAATDAVPHLRWPGCELRRHRDRLYAMPPLEPLPDDPSQRWRDGTRLPLPAGDGELRADRPPPWPLEVRRLRPGETIRPAGGRPTQDCRKLHQARGIPVWLRSRLPVLDAGDDRVCILGLAATAEWTAAAAGWSVAWHHERVGLATPIAWPDPPLTADCP
jgi:tRNA(Ile)-lysidine synthase